MPKEKISDDVMSGWYAEVSWRGQEHVCPCGNIWLADVPTGEQCPECKRTVPATSGHVQVASVNPDSPFVFPANPHAPEAEPATQFDGWRVTLDGDQLAYLIAVLQKAKRQAYPTR